MTDIVNLSEVRLARTTEQNTYEITDLPGNDAAARPVDLAKTDSAEHDAATDDPSAGVALVDAGPRLAAAKTSPRDRSHLPIVPPWMRDPAAAKAAAQWAVRYYAHCAAFHAVRLPLYWARLAARSPIGAA